MRKSLGLAAAAILAAGTLGAQSTGASAAPSPASTAVKADPSAAAASALEALGAHPGIARAAVEQEFMPTETMVDRDGSTHVRMDRTYKGLPVIGGDLVVHQDAASALEGVSQTLRAPLSLSAKPAVRAGRAQSTALTPAKLVGKIRNLRAADVAPELVVDALGAEPRLAWEVTTLGRQADGTPSRLTTYVDARNGAVIRRVEGIHTADGEGNSLYSGTVPISVTKSGSSFTLTDAAHGNAKTTDMQNKTDSVLCTLLEPRLHQRGRLLQPGQRLRHRHQRQP